MEKKTNISRKHLQALESCTFSELPDGSIYHKNYLKRYLEALDVDAAAYIKQFEEEELRYMKQPKTSHPRKHIHHLHFGNLPGLIRYAGVAVVILIIAGYLGYQIKHIVDPPKMTVLSPQNGLISDQSSVTVQGKTEKEVRVSINGTEIMNNEEGIFEQSIDLTPGLNTITITAEKKHGKTTVETRHVVLKEEPEPES